MELHPVILVIVDISGYTRFIQLQKTSVMHAEQIISELLEAVVSQAEYPLTLNKLEGDAALLFTKFKEGESEAAAQDVTRQIGRFFKAFEACQTKYSQGPVDCPCDACQNATHLRLKAFLHLGQAVIKQFRQFEELAGEDVILIHRLLKNSLKVHEYVLMTEPFYRASGGMPGLKPEPLTEKVETLGPVKAMVYYPNPEHNLKRMAGEASQAGSLRRWVLTLRRRLSGEHKAFHHIPY
jgi:hypothetical protein